MCSQEASVNHICHLGTQFHVTTKILLGLVAATDNIIHCEEKGQSPVFQKQCSSGDTQHFCSVETGTPI